MYWQYLADPSGTLAFHTLSAVEVQFYACRRLDNKPKGGTIMVHDRKPMSDNYIQLVRAFQGLIVASAVQHHEGMINWFPIYMYIVLLT